MKITFALHAKKRLCVVAMIQSSPAFLTSTLIQLRSERSFVLTRMASSQPSEQTSSISPIVTYRGKVLQARQGDNLRQLLLRKRCHPHNGGLLVTCKGLGTCGTCAVAIKGAAQPSEPSWRERARLSFPPHTPENSAQKNLRLACQVSVVDDLTVEKYDGFWGHGDVQLDHMA